LEPKVSGYRRQAEISLRLLRASSFWQQTLAAQEGLDDPTAAMILDTAAALAESELAELGPISDRVACRVENGRVITPEAYKPAWRAVCDGGWIGLDLPESAGGQGLPLALQTASQMLLDRPSLAFGMLAGSTRSGAFVLDAFAPTDIQEEWLPRLVTGEWSTTICISEPDAGSDVGRIRTRAEQVAGSWQITGQKCWISYGDHDLTSRIGHLLLARTGPAELGTRGLSLFLVPDSTPTSPRNGITVERIEEKLGLHGSPTCVLSFNGAEAILLGELNRGLPQLFVMIERMRLLTAGMGAATAVAALDIAEHYAVDRRQGGAPNQPPVPIIDHADVQRQIGRLAARTWIAHAFVLELAAIMDRAETATGSEKEDLQALAAWLLPIAKNFGAETGFDSASAAIQVLGGAGYTTEWPAERLLRDSRILSIFEGTTAMQAMDLLYRRLWKEEGRGFKVFAGLLRQEASTAREDVGAAALQVLVRLEEITLAFSEMQAVSRAMEHATDAFFRATWAGTMAWIALRLAKFATDPRDNLDRYLGAVGECGLHEAQAEITAAAARVRGPSHAMQEIAALLKSR
jgi:alkylation response protein AidB-like acyl-CoA dehydrogenase